MVAIEGELAREVQQILQWAGYYDGPFTGEYDASTQKALSNLIGNENFEERFDEEKGLISHQVMDVLRLKFTQKT
jgi:peptidoglycan hydrolase-like protein with peptidoglycan-binding domain